MAAMTSNGQLTSTSKKKSFVTFWEKQLWNTDEISTDGVLINWKKNESSEAKLQEEVESYCST
jgi:hypothetical protein